MTMNSQWVFTADELRRTPSSQAGHTIERERIERMKGCDFILKVGMKLRLPQTTISTACVFLHRFYMRFTLREFHHYDIGATALFLATKCEETTRKLSDIVISCAKTAQKNDNVVIDEQSKDYWTWRDVILYNEELLLEALCFDLVVDHSYSLLKSYWRQFGAVNEIAKAAWCIANDTYRTTICLMYDIHTVAATCLYYASVFTAQPLSKMDGKAWFEVLDVDTSKAQGVIETIVELYEAAQQVAKDSLDPKALAAAGTDAKLKLLAEIEEVKSRPATAESTETNGTSKRSQEQNGNGTGKRVKLESDVRPETASSEGEIKETASGE